MGSLTFSAGISVEDKLPFKNWFEDIHYCVVDYTVGESGGTNQALFGVCDYKMPVLSMFVFAVQKRLAEGSKIFFFILSKINVSCSQTLVF